MEYIGTTGKIYKTVDPPLGKGGEGSVYKISKMPDCVLKVFLDNKRSETRHKKLLAMLSTPLSADAMKQITWPIDVVYENGSFAGYVMPAIKNNEDLNVMYSDKYSCSLADKIIIAKNLCAAINAVHETDQVCGDLNPKNISVDPQCAIVTLVDTDSYHITEADKSRVYRCEVGLPEYLPREIQEKMKNGQTLASAPLPTFTKQTDLFALAVHIFALLMNGCHPFACAIDNRQNINHLSISKASVVAPQPIDNICSGFFPFYENRSGITTPKYAPPFNYLPKNIQDLFIRAFVKGHKDPSLRPTADEWYTALTIMQGKLKTCNKEKHHMYPEHNNSCPWCSINAVLNAVNRPSPPNSGPRAIAQKRINGQQHYATRSNQNTGTSNKSNVPVGKIIVLVLCVIIGILLLKSCLGKKDTSSYNKNDNNYAGETTLLNESDYRDTEDENTPDFVSETQSLALEQIVVDDIKKELKSIDAISAKQSSCEAVEFINHHGSITTENQKDDYIYSVVNDGRARIEISELQSGTAVELYVYNSAGERISSDTYCTNGEGITLKSLEAGQTYKIQVCQEAGYSNYTLTIGQPKAAIDVSQITEIKDSIEFTDQRNVYSFTAPRDGRYRFELSEITNGCAVELYVFNSLGESLGSDTYCTNGEGVTLKSLKAKEEYTINVRYASGYSGYTLSIGNQKATVDLTGFTKVNDSIEYTDQRNVYTFTPPEDGRYRLEIEGLKSGCAVELYVFNYLDEVVNSDTYCTNGEGVTLKDLKASETYEIQVRQSSGKCPYILNIGYQKSTIGVGSNMEVSDSIEYTDQRNVYIFTAKKSGSHTFTISGLSSGCAVELYAFNNLGETVKSDTYCTNDEGITIENISVGETYEIQVRQSSGLSDYKLSIEQS